MCFETADLQAHVARIESGNAVALLPGLMSARRKPNATMIELTGAPHRTIFTATRASIVSRPAIVACRAVLARVVADGMSTID